MQKSTEERSCIWRLKARETEHMSPVKLTPIVFEIGRRELTNRVCRDEDFRVVLREGVNYGLRRLYPMSAPSRDQKQSFSAAC
jgi:hypothetical protein